MSVEEITISRSIYEKMLELSRKVLPYEACGILSGKNNQTLSIWPLKNEIKSSKRFFVSEKIVEETMQKIEELDEEVIAIYHTHPLTKPIPSHYDLIHHADDDVKMIIISFQLTYPIVKCYRITGSHYEECLFSIESI